MKVSDMTEGNSLKLILRFAIPLFIGTLFQQAYNIIDTMIAGYNIGDEAIAAIGATASLYAVIVYFATGLNSGYGIIISRLFGAKDIGRLKNATATMVSLNLGITIVLTGVSLPLLHPLLKLLDTPAEIYEMTYQYIFVILAGMAAAIAYNMCAAFLQALGNSNIPLYFLIMSCIINLSLDYLFIAGFHMGVAGAGFATIIAESISALSCMIYIIRKYREYLPGKKDWKLDKTLTLEMFTTGTSMGLMLSVFSLGSIILQKAINNLGTQIITAHTASRRIYEVFAIPLSTAATATATFVGQNFGARKYQRIDNALKKIIFAALLWSAVSIFIAIYAGEFMVKLLIDTNDPVIMENALLNLRLSTAFFFPLGILIIMRNAMQSMGYKVTPVLSSGIELLVKILATFLVVPNLGYTGVAFTEPVIWVLCAVFIVAVYLTSRKSNRLHSR